ncbi:putative mediator of RNA polymerase II transcription subunit 26 [Sesamum indicum]|uniref:Mediator of RNA polymerase II transcription subunit 26 n=1 Tax=Sesamum indicum TaxID=4182 RepID=A0A8M8UYR7_SESIN|nr:putative mediator of RNA polymerase II transcription subunit 26 [Sesamum indicum]
MLPPCAACKCLRRKCTNDCVFARYFPADNPSKFTSVHKVYGACNVAKLLKELGTDSQRNEAVKSLVYEAEYRLRDPVHGCVGHVALLQQKLRQVQHDLECAKKELSTYIAPSEMLPQQQPQQNFLPSVYQMMPSHVQQMMIPTGVPLPHRGQLVIREPNLQEQQHQQKQILEAQQLVAMAAAMEQETLRSYQQQQLQQLQEQEVLRAYEQQLLQQLQEQEVLRADEQQQLQHQQQLQQQQGHDLVRFNNVFDDGAGPSTATGFNEMPEEAAAMEQEMLRAYEQQQLQQLQEQEVLRADEQQQLQQLQEQEVLRADEQQQLQYQQQLQHQQQLQQQQGHDLVRFNNVFDDGAGPSTATGFNEMPEKAAAMEQEMLRAYEQQQLQHLQQQQEQELLRAYAQQLQQQTEHDLVRFSTNVFDDGAGPSTATGFNEMPEEAAAMEQEMLRAYEQQLQQQAAHDLVRLSSNVFDDGAGPSTATGFNEMPEEAAAKADGMQPFMSLGGSYETNPYHHIQHHNLVQEQSFSPSHPHTDHPNQLQLVATEELFLQQQEQQRRDVTSHNHLQQTEQQLASSTPGLAVPPAIPER